MKIAIMQPYIFPYIGYFQLINVVDKFIIYDDVNYIKQGWINRNNILIQNKINLFTVPLANASSFTKICQIEINVSLFEKWKKNFLKSIEQSYKKAPYYNNTIEIIENTLNIKEVLIAEYTYRSIQLICDYLDIKTVIQKSSDIYENNELKSETRIIDICKKENCTDYFNPIGGLELYSKSNFKNNNINLHFIKSNHIQYKQFKEEFLSNLSIIDVLMFNSPTTVKDMLNQFQII